MPCPALLRYGIYQAKKGCLLFILLATSWGSLAAQNSLDSLFAKAESYRINATVDSALLLLEQALNSAQQANRLPEWQINQARCLSDIDSLLPAQQLLEKAKSRLQLPQQDLLLAEALNLQGSIALQQNLWPQAKQYYEEALGIRETYLGQFNEKVADSHNNLGAIYYLLQDYNQALLHHQQALTIRLEILAPPHPDLGSSYNNLAACYYDQGDISAAINYNQKALEQRISSFSEQHPSVADSYNNLGNCFFEQFQLEKAIEYHQKALRISQKLERPLAQAASLNNIGNCWLELGDFQRALQAFQEAIALYQRHHSSQYPPIADIAINQGNAYLAIGDLPNALNSFQMARLLLEQQHGTNTPNRIPALLGQATTLQQMADYATAIPIFQEAIQQMQSPTKQRYSLLPDAYNNLGNCFFQQSNFTQARQYYQAAITAYGSSPNTSRQRASTRFNLGNCYQQEGNYTTALDYYEQALAQSAGTDLYFKIQSARAATLLQKGDLSNAQKLLENQFDSLQQSTSIPRPGWIDLYLQLAALYLEDQPQQRRQSALFVYQQAARQLDQLLIYNRSRQAKRELRLNYFQLYERGINVAFQLYTTHKDPQWLEAAFWMAEKSKALLIRQASNEAVAQHFTQLPDSLIAQENGLQQQIAEYEQLRYEQAALLDSLTLRELDLALLSLRDQHNALINQLETSFPDYFHLKYQSEPPSLAQIEAQLPNQQAILSYFLGYQQAYVFVIRASGCQLIVLDNQQLTQKTIQIWDAISNFTSAQVAADYQLYAQQYTQNAHQLFHQLLAPIESKQDLPETLTIIPDGILCYLPFDLLLRQPVDSSQLYRFEQHSYLIRDYQISYAYSVDQWQRAQQDKPQQRLRWAGFAPTFFPEKSRFQPLYHNETEVRNIARLLPGNPVFTGAAASLATLEEQIQRPSIIHLATHGLANAYQSDFAYLAFSQPDSTEQLLYTQNLYAMDLQKVGLVVLSACETGLGEALPGEGVMSLAHAFRYAGAQSIITTLWSIDDEKTATIMQHFYQQLVSGKSKDQALRSARLTYLQAHNGAYAHPFYWAAFVPIGDMDAVTFVKKNNSQIYIISLSLLLTIIGIWRIAPKPQWYKRE